MHVPIVCFSCTAHTLLWTHFYGQHVYDDDVDDVDDDDDDVDDHDDGDGDNGYDDDADDNDDDAARLHDAACIHCLLTWVAATHILQTSLEKVS